MSDIDDELLALAGGGGDSSDDEGASNNHSRASSRSPAKPVSKPPKRGTAVKKPAKRRKQDSDEEEGEASDASADSLGSAQMDESDSDSDAAGPSRNIGTSSKPNNMAADDITTRYPVEGIFASVAEKAEIMAMREIDREQVLAERRQEQERHRQTMILRQLMKNQGNKRKAGAAELDDEDGEDGAESDEAGGPRKTSRVRTKVGGTKVGETSSALDSLKRARAEKSDRMRRRAEERASGRRDRSPSYRRSPDAEQSDESDVEWASSRRRSRTPEHVKEAPPAELRDLERVRLGRSRFAKVCFYPGFEDAITGCYVRISIGLHPDTRENQYRIALVKGFTSGRPYAIEDERGKSFVTDQYLNAAHGKATKEWPFIACSDSPFTESEWNRYTSTLKYESINLPKQPNLVRKIDDINNLVSRVWTEDELQAKLNRQNKLRDRFSGAERQKLEAQMQKARIAGDTDRAEQLQDELDHLEQPRLAFKTSISSTNGKQNGHHNNTHSTTNIASTKQSQQERLAALNAENRKLNSEAVRKAQLKERHRLRELEAKIERGEEVEGHDTTSRLKTKMKFVHDGANDSKASSRQGSRQGTPSGGTPRLGATKVGGGSVLPRELAKMQLQGSQGKNGSGGGLSKAVTDDDVIGALDLDIDVEI